MRQKLLAAACGLVVLASLVLVARGRAAQGSTVERLDLAGLFARSELVLDARVATVRVERDPRQRPETIYELATERTFFGAVQPTHTLRVLGGVLADGSGLTIPGLPRLARGERALVFLTPTSTSGQRTFVGLAQGRLRVVHDAQGAPMLERDLDGVATIDPGSGAIAPAPSASTLDYAAVAARLDELAASRKAAEARGREARESSK